MKKKKLEDLFVKPLPKEIKLPNDAETKRLIQLTIDAQNKLLSQWHCRYPYF